MLSADLILYNGNLITLDPVRSRATAMAIVRDRIAWVGNDADILKLAGEQTQKIDLRGRTVTPGFCDAHLHLHWYGMQLLQQVDLVGTQNIDEILERLRWQSERTTALWLRGHGFDQEKLTERRFPTRTDLDRVSQTRPIIVSRVCGHAVVVNSAALSRISESERASGDPETGLYTEGDANAFYRQIPPMTESEAEAAVEMAQAVALRTGITSIQTLLDTPNQMGTYARLRRKDKLRLRVTGMPPYSAVESLHQNGVNTTFGDTMLRFGAAKLFSDGSLGARTALLSAPYADDSRPDNFGIRIYEPDELKRRAKTAQQCGYQVAIHAIGDQAVRETLDALEYALGANGDNTYHRHRVEHASLLSPDQMERMANRKIVAVVQPQFVRSDVWTGERVGAERATWAYPFRSMLRAGIPLALSSDCPVETVDAFACLAAVVGRATWSPEETLTPEEALTAYCMGGAYAGHAEERVGSLTAGKLADFVVLSADPTRLDAEGIASLKAKQVFIGGHLVHTTDP